MTGTIQEINAELGDQPSLINKSPEDKGELMGVTWINEVCTEIRKAWLCKIKLSDPKEVCVFAPFRCESTQIVCDRLTGLWTLRRIRRTASRLKWPYRDTEMGGEAEDTEYPNHEL